jgi:hypothetical protein
MAAGPSTIPAPDSDRAWFILQRWQAYYAEGRANLLRIVAIGLFYFVHLLSYWSAQGKLPAWGFLQLADKGAINEQFHIIITMLAAAWAMLALGLLICLQQRIFPRWLPYLSTACDIIMLTAVLCVSIGAKSPLVAGYFLILTLAALRLHLPLIWFTTAGCALGYLAVLGRARWFPPREGLPDVLLVPRYHQLIVLVALLLAGIMLGQIIRRVRSVAEEFARNSPPSLGKGCGSKIPLPPGVGLGEGSRLI